MLLQFEQCAFADRRKVPDVAFEELCPCAEFDRAVARHGSRLRGARKGRAARIPIDVRVGTVGIE